MMKKILNPFDYLPLRQAICWGIAALILISVYCWQVGLLLSSLTQINYGGGALWRATAQQVVAWLLFSVVLYVVALLFSRSKVRFWDVAAYNLFARIPFHLSLLLFAIPMVRSIMGLLTDGSIATAMQYASALTLIGLVSLLFVVWYFFWSYKAFAVATNLKNGRGVALFIVAYIISYVASPFLLTLI